MDRLAFHPLGAPDGHPAGTGPETTGPREAVRLDDVGAEPFWLLEPIKKLCFFSWVSRAASRSRVPGMWQPWSNRPLLKGPVFPKSHRV